MATMDDADLKMSVTKDNTERLRAELKVGQNVFTDNVVDAMERRELIEHVVTLRRLAGQTTAVRAVVPGFSPTVHTAATDVVSDRGGVGATALTAGHSPLVTDLASMMAMFMQNMAEERRLASAAQERRDVAAALEKRERLEAREKREAAEALERRECREHESRRQEAVCLEKQEQAALLLEERARIAAALDEERLRAATLRDEERNLDRLRDVAIADAKRLDDERVAARHRELLDAQRERDRNDQIRADRIDDRATANNRKIEVRLKRANEIMRGVLYPMSISDVSEMPIYFESVERLFDMNHIDEDLRVSLITPLLNDKSRRLLFNMTVDDLRTFGQLKTALLREHRLTPAVYRKNFSNACKAKDESFVQYSTRLACLFKHYADSRELASSYEKLVSLIVADRLKDCLSPNTRAHILNKEGRDWMTAPEIAELADIFESDLCYQYMKPSVSSKPAAQGVSSGRPGEVSGQGTRSQARCYKCNGFGHFANQCRGNTVQASTPPTGTKPVAPNNYAPRPVGQAPRVCYKCSSPAHLANRCPERAFKGRVNRVTVVPPEALVHLTDGASPTKTLLIGRVGAPGEARSVEAGQIVMVNFGREDVECLVDSGAEISVLQPSMCDEGASDESGVTELMLQGAFGEAISAKLSNVAACLVKSPTVGVSRAQAMLCCAISSKLVGARALLTVADYMTLVKASDTFIPEVTYISNTRILFDDPLVNHNSNSNRLEILAVNSTDLQAVDRGEKIHSLNLPRLGVELTRIKEVDSYRVSQMGDESLKACWEKASQSESGFVRRSENHLLYRLTIVGGFQISQLVLPSNKRQQVMKIAHDSDWSGHFGSRKTLLRIEAHFWWPTMKVDVQSYVASCCGCQQQKRIVKLDRIPIAPVIRATTSFEMVNIDLIGPLEPMSSGGHKYILCLIDSCTRWVEAVPLRTLTARETCDALLSIFSRIGIPRIVVSDNGTNMVAGLTQELYERLGVELRCSTPYHPEGNSLVERWNQNLKHMLHHVLISDEPRAWDKRLPYLLWAYRELPNATTGLSPYQLVYGRVGRGPLSVLKDSWSDDQVDAPLLTGTSAEYLEKLKADLQVGHSIADQCAGKRQRSYVHQYNLRARDKEFAVGDMVLVLMPDSTNKVLARWQGPGTVTARMSPHSYRVSLDTGAVRTLHANDLRRFVPRVSSVGVIFDDDTDFGAIEYCPLLSAGISGDAIAKLDLSHLAEIEQGQLRTLLNRHQGVFNDKPGECKVTCHEINLQEGFRPKSLRPYRVPDKLRAEVDSQVAQLLQDGRIRKSNSPYAHPIVCVSKPDGSVRLCCDFRHVNSGTINDAYPMPRSEDLVNRISGAKYISTLDCTSGYWQIPMRESDISKTAFVTHNGLYEWLVMPFGLKTASNSFQRVMDELLRSHSPYAGAYIDDTAVFSDQWSDHLEHLDRVLTAVAEAGLTLRLAKCKFSLPKVKFIGHLIGSGTKAVLQDKVEAIRALPEPHTKKLLRSFLGMCGFYRSYIPKFSDIARPLTEMTKNRHANNLRFNEEQRASFLALKKHLCESTTLYTPQTNLPFIIRSDASDYAVGASLSQVDGEGLERPIAFASAKLSDVQTRWSTIEKEAYAVIFALRKFDVNVFGGKIHLFTDHNPLQYLVTCAPNSSKLTRWALSLSRYDITVSHIAGKDNVTADCLSRN